MGFDFQKTIVALDLDIEDIDIFFGLMKPGTQIMNGRVPQRDGWEQDALSMQVFIEALTKPKFVVLDAYTFTCGVFVLGIY